MTRRQEEMKVIDGKKVCWMYRKGRCRQGAKCKFGHDNDVKTDRIAAENKYDAESQISSDKAANGAAHPIRFNPAEREISPPKVGILASLGAPPILPVCPVDFLKVSK